MRDLNIKIQHYVGDTNLNLQIMYSTFSFSNSTLVHNKVMPEAHCSCVSFQRFRVEVRAAYNVPMQYTLGAIEVLIATMTTKDFELKLVRCHEVCVRVGRNSGGSN